MWRTDGTAAGTALVKDIWAGPGSSHPFVIASDGKIAYLLANDGTHGEAIWKTDGTADGTVLVADTTPDPILTNDVLHPYPAAILNGSLIYTNNGSLYIANDTAGVTKLADGVAPAVDFAQLNGMVYLLTNSGQTGAGAFHEAIWRTDGSAAGTVQVLTTKLFNTGGDRPQLTVVGNFLYYGDLDTNDQLSIWRTDGNPGAGTFVYEADPQYLHAIGNVPYIFTNSAILKVTNGPLAVNKVSSFSGPVPFTTLLGSNLYFGLSANFNQDEQLWKFDGTNTSLIKTIPGGGGPQNLVGNELYFVAYDSQLQAHLWKSNGTSAGTQEVIFPAIPVTAPWGAVNGKLFFGAKDDVNGAEPWVSDGTPEGTHLLVDLNPTHQMSNPTIMGGDAANLFFTAVDEFQQRQIYVIGPNGGPAVRLTNLVNGIPEGDRWQFVGKGTAGYVFTSEHSGVWSSDGTPEGTRMETGGPPDANGFPLVQMFRGLLPQVGAEYLYPPTGATVVGTGLYYTVADGVHDGLYRTTVDPGALRITSDQLYKGPASSLVAGDSAVYFIGANSTIYRVDDGTDAAIAVGQAPSDVYTPAAGVRATSLYWATGNLYIQGVDHLWRLDMTTGIPVAVATVPHPAQTSTSFSNFAAANGYLFFVTDNGDGPQLWKSDGTLAGTGPVADFALAAGSEGPVSLTVVNDRVYFSDDVQGSGRRVYVTDGTSQGTMLVPGLQNAPFDPNADYLAADGGTIYFSARDVNYGQVIWRLVTTSPPAKPTGFHVTVSTYLAWNAVDAAATGLQLERSTDPSFSTATIIPLNVGDTSYADQGAAGGAVYYYRLRALGTDGVSTVSDTVSAQAGTAGITGRVFVDLNHNGVFDTGDQGQSGWTIYIDMNHDGAPDAGDIMTTSGDGGSYTLADLPAGTFTVRVNAPSGWASVTPIGGTADLTIDDGQTTDQDFIYAQRLPFRPVFRPRPKQLVSSLMRAPAKRTSLVR